MTVRSFVLVLVTMCVVVISLLLLEHNSSIPPVLLEEEHSSEIVAANEEILAGTTISEDMLQRRARAKGERKKAGFARTEEVVDRVAIADIRAGQMIAGNHLDAEGTIPFTVDQGDRSLTIFCEFREANRIDPGTKVDVLRPAPDRKRSTELLVEALEILAVDFHRDSAEKGSSREKGKDNGGGASKVGITLRVSPEQAVVLREAAGKHSLTARRSKPPKRVSTHAGKMESGKELPPNMRGLIDPDEGVADELDAIVKQSSVPAPPTTATDAPPSPPSPSSEEPGAADLASPEGESKGDIPPTSDNSSTAKPQGQGISPSNGSPKVSIHPLPAKAK